MTELFDISASEIRLMVGEMSAQEMRTVKAVLAGLKARSMARPTPSSAPGQEVKPVAFRFRLKDDDPDWTIWEQDYEPWFDDPSMWEVEPLYNVLAAKLGGSNEC